MRPLPLTPLFLALDRLLALDLLLAIYLLLLERLDLLELTCLTLCGLPLIYTLTWPGVLANIP